MSDTLETLAEYSKNKNGLIIGPSSNVLQDVRGIDVDGYDVIVRLDGHYNRKDKRLVPLGIFRNLLND